MATQRFCEGNYGLPWLPHRVFLGDLLPADLLGLANGGA